MDSSSDVIEDSADESKLDNGLSSSDVIEDSGDESKVDNSLYVSSRNFDSRNSLPQRPSYEDEVEESDAESNVDSSYQSPENRRNTSEENEYTPRRSKSFTFSDEDEEYEAITKSARKPRVRRIASDSEDEYEPAETPATNKSFTNMRTPKVLDSDSSEDENENSSVDFITTAEISNNFKEIGDNEVDKLSVSLNNSASLVEKEASPSNKSHTINNNVNKTASDEASPSNKSHTINNNLKTASEETSHSNKSLTTTQDANKRNTVDIKTDNESFREHAEEISSSSEKSDNEVISIPSSDNEEENATATKLQQPTIDSMVKNMSLIGAGDNNASKGDQVFCTAAEYANQSSTVANLRTNILKCKNILRTANLSSLPDKGALLIKRQQNLETQLVFEENKLKNMVVNHTEAPEKKPTWDQLQATSSYVVPNTFGKQAMNTYVAQKTLTMERLKNLHDSLATCPDEDTLAEDPKGIKVDLMPHQKRALAWLIWREGQKPSGGILADDMGLGKTLTMISLILATKETHIDDDESDNSNSEESVKWTSKNKKYKANGGTLVICPATLIRQWESEVASKLKRNLLTTELYHGNRRETSSARLAKYDVVITTYKLAQGEYEKKGPLYNIKWKRIILDEAHVIRNPKSLTSVATCEFRAKSRWALTGTPVHNKELDLYALLKFLRCSPFDDLAIWKRWVANKNAGGQDRLNTVIQSILLRRTKDQLQGQGALQSLPEKKFEVIQVSLDNAERQIYQKLLIFSKTLFIQFLHQRAEKNPEFSNIKGGNLKETNDEEFNRMHRKVMQAHGNTEVKSHEILTLLLRLRQICCHPSLISSMLDDEDRAAEGIEEGGVDIDMLDKLINLNLNDENIENEPPSASSNQPEKLNAVANKVLSSSNPVFDRDRTNEKMRVIQKIIEEKVLPNNDKIIIVSQWTSMLNLVFSHLRSCKIRCDILDGKVPVHKRNDIVVDFNNPASKVKVLLLSLTAGGVGLNLVGANHLLLVDLHWNPQLESQAQDRIYRVGQKKTVHIYKIVTSETIEERIKALQDSKLSMASDILSGVRPGAGSKLSLDDLKMLFNVAG